MKINWEYAIHATIGMALVIAFGAQLHLSAAGWALIIAIGLISLHISWTIVSADPYFKRRKRERERYRQMLRK